MFSFKTAARMKFISRIGIGLSSLAIFVLLLFSYYSENVGNFTIDLSQELYLEKEMVLSEAVDFAEGRSRLSAIPIGNVVPIGIRGEPETLPVEVVASLSTFSGGNNNGNNFFAYVFYTKNTGETALSYNLTMYVDDAKNHVDEAIRIMIIVERNINSLTATKEQFVYAKAQSAIGENPGLPEPGSLMFYAPRIVFTSNRFTFEPGFIDKFTVVMWVHGEDPDCTDLGDRAITSGTLRMSMKFGILDA